MLTKLATPLFVKLAAGVGLAMLITIGILSWKVSTMGDTIDAQNVRIGGLQRDIDHQNAAVQLQSDLARAAQARADAAVAEALRVNHSRQPVIVSLRESGARQRGAGERCEISETLRNAEGL